MSTDFSTLLNKSDLCARLSLSPRTAENMVKAKAFKPPVRIGKHRLSYRHPLENR